MKLQILSLAKLFLLVALVMVAAGGWMAYAQVPTGSIVGTVTDAQGLAVGGASVTITNQGTGRAYKVTTSDLGTFEVFHLDAGFYRVEVSKAGFRSSVISDVKLDAGTQYSLPPTILEIGAVTETVNVRAGANLVQTTSAQVSGTVERKQIEALPLFNRDPLNLLSLQAGVNQNGRTVTVINGQRQSFSNVTLDGINIQDNFIRSNDLDFLPNLLLLNEVSEFTITNQNAGPEAGLGASQVSFVTPSGTNNWHGDGFWYHRNSVLAANDWFNNKNAVKKGGLIQNQGGGSIGGPIFKNKLFAYGYYELFRSKQQTPQNHTVLTSTARQGVFTWTPPGSTTPQQVKLFGSGGLRPSLAIDPFVASLLTGMPTTINNFTVGDSKSASQLFNSAGFSVNKRQNRTRDNYGVRLDWNASEHHSFAGTWAWNRDILDRPDIDTSFNLVPVVSNDESIKFLSTAWRWSPKATFTNEVRFGFNLAPAIFNTAQDFSKGFVLSGLLYTNPDTTFRAQGRNTNTYSWQDNGSYLRGNHAFKFGGLVQRIHVKPFNDAGTIEQLNLGISAANTSGLQSSEFASRGGITAADLATANNLLVSLVGFVSSIQQGFNVTSRTSGFVPGATNIRNLTLNDWSLYAGDSWRLRKNLTLELGLRWEYVGRFDEQNGLILVPVIPAGQTPLETLLSNATVDFAGGDTGRSIYNKDLNNFAPQIGIAWDPQGNGKMAIRTGYSIHFVNDETIRAADNATSAIQGLSSTNSVLKLTNTISSSLPPIPTPTFKVPRTFRDNRLNLGVLNSTGFMVDPNIRTPYVQEWNLSIQREIGWNTSLSVAYVGNKGTKLYRGIDYNQVLILPNGFLADFLRARSNFFLTGNPACTPAQNPECQTLTVFPHLASGGLLNNATIRGLIQRGEVGELAATYYTNNLAGTVQFTPNPDVFVADLLQNFSNSNYHSGVVEVRRRFGRGLYFQANYVFSKVLTDYAAPTNNDQARFSPLLDNAQPRIEKSRAEFDLTHAFKGNFVYELPVGKGHRFAPFNSALSRIVSGWSLTSVFTWQSGPPFSILSNRGTLNRAARSTGKNTAISTFSSQQLSNFVGVFFQSGQVFAINPTFIGPDGRGVPADAVTCKPLVTGGFCNPDPGTVGTLSRLAFGGPTFFNWDFSVIKQTPITESKKLEYRAEFFNVLNHPTFFVGDQNVNSTTFGVIGSTSSTARLIQMSLRFIF